MSGVILVITHHWILEKNPNVEKRHGAARARVFMMTELILRVMGI
jgi:hypothetical protein